MPRPAPPAAQGTPSNVAHIVFCPEIELGPAVSARMDVIQRLDQLPVAAIVRRGPEPLDLRL